MTVSTENCYAERNWTGVETSFTPGFGARDRADVLVYARDPSNGAVTQLTLGTHFAVTLDVASGAVLVTPIALPAAPQTILILRNTPALQDTNFANLNKYAPGVHSRLHDAAALRDSEDKFHRVRSLKAPLGETLNDLPRAADRAGKLLKFGIDGHPLALPPENGLAPAGGTAGQVLKKNSPADYDYDWLPVGGAASGAAATEISFAPAGNIAATNVQDALAELDAEKAPLGAQVLDPGANGIVVRIGALGASAARSLVAPAAGFTISNSDGVAGNPTFALADDLAALEALAGNGFAARIGAATWAQRSFDNAAAGITWTNADGVAGNPTPVLANDLAALEGLVGTGFAVRTAADTWAERSLVAPEAGISITNPAGVGGNPTLVLTHDLAALEALPVSGLACRTGESTWATRVMQAPAAGFTITNGGGSAGNPTFALANDLAALEGLGSTGIAVRTAADTWAQRTIAGTANEITITNGNGVAGNPTASLPAALTFTGKTITGGSYASPTVTGTMDLSGGQIAFPATQSPSAGANTLDDYEKGTWTPVLTATTPGNLSVTYAAQNGYYTKIGRSVILSCVIITSGFTHTTAAGGAQITGSPFAASSGSNAHAYAALNYSGLNKAGGYAQGMAGMSAGTNYQIVIVNGMGVAAVAANITDFPTGGSVVLAYTVTFHV